MMGTRLYSSPLTSRKSWWFSRCRMISLGIGTRSSSPSSMVKLENTAVLVRKFKTSTGLAF